MCQTDERSKFIFLAVLQYINILVPALICYVFIFLLKCILLLFIILTSFKNKDYHCHCHHIHFLGYPRYPLCAPDYDVDDPILVVQSLVK